MGEHNVQTLLCIPEKNPNDHACMRLEQTLYFLSARPVEGLGSVHNPAKSCDEILISIPNAQSGVYWFQAARGRPYQVIASLINVNS